MNNMCAGDGPHDFALWKQRGTRERDKCKRCGVVTPWTKSERPSEQPTIETARNYDDLNSKTVESLKSLARDKGITGISKMKKADLVAVLSG